MTDELNKPTVTLITLLTCIWFFRLMKEEDAKKKHILKKKKFPWLTPESSYGATSGNTFAKGPASFILKTGLDRHDKPLLPNHNVFNQMEAAALSQNTFHSAIITPITWSEQTSAKNHDISPHHHHRQPSILPHHNYPLNSQQTLSSLCTTNSDRPCSTLEISTANEHLLRRNMAETSPGSRRLSSPHRRRPRMFFRAAKRSQLLCVLYSSFVVHEADSHGKLVGAGRVLAGA